MTPDELAAVFCEARGARDTDASLGERIEALWQRARAAWPGVELGAEAFARHLGRVLAQPESQDLRLESLHTDDLYLARACAAGDPRAIAACESSFTGEMNGALGRQGVDSAAGDDLKQQVREWLFVAGSDGEPGVLTYQGRGRLGGWLKVIITRRALKSFRGQHRLRPLDEEAQRLADRPGLVGGDPEQQLSKLLFRSEFRDAFREAVAALDEEDRRLLARNILEGASIDVLGQELGVHRATAARRLEKARRNLFFAIRRTIMRRHRLDRAGYDSVLGLVQSQLDLSARLLLGDGG